MILMFDEMETGNGGILRIPYIQDSQGVTCVQPIAIVDGNIWKMRGRLNIKDISGQWVEEINNGAICKFFSINQKMILVKLCEKDQININIPLRITIDTHNNNFKNCPNEIINIGNIIYVYENYIMDNNTWLKMLDNMRGDVLTKTSTTKLESYIVSKMTKIDAMSLLPNLVKKVKKMSNVKKRMFHSSTNKHERHVCQSIYFKLVLLLFNEVKQLNLENCHGREKSSPKNLYRTKEFLKNW